MLELLKELGIGLSVDIPQDAYDKLLQLQQLQQQSQAAGTRCREKSKA